MSISGMLKYAIKSLMGGKNMLKKGEPAPDFCLSRGLGDVYKRQAPDFNSTDHNGKPVSLKGFRGRKVVLWFFPKADTPG